MLSYLANILGCSLNFLIARTWGRPAIKKLAGEMALRKIEQLPHISSAKVVFILKLVGSALTDYISYAVGLSRLAYSSYFIASAFAILPMMIFGFLLISNVELESVTSTISSIGFFYAINYATSLLVVPISLYISKKDKISE